MNRSQREERGVGDRRWAKKGSDSWWTLPASVFKFAGSTLAASTTEPSGRFFTDFSDAHTVDWLYSLIGGVAVGRVSPAPEGGGERMTARGRDVGETLEF